jgi:DNA-binding NarL/FixJ family response regulator
MTEARRIRIAIADDHLLFRQGLRSLLQLSPELEVVAEVATTGELRAALASNPCDVLLLDLQMERWSMDEIPELSRLAKVIVLTASESVENGVRALRLGARGVVQKRFAIETLVTAIKTVMEGMVWMPPALQTEFAKIDKTGVRSLTAREAEIVRLVGIGLHNTEVAERLSISESTVKTHLNNIFQKLGVRDRLELTHYAIRTGLVTLIESNR